MSKSIVPEANEKVKCSYEGCEEEPFRDGICWYHFIEEEDGYIFGDVDPALDLSWWGDDPYELQGDNHGYPR